MQHAYVVVATSILMERGITCALAGRMVSDENYRRIRAQTEALAEPLSPEDQALQSFPEASPTKWHLAHSTWFYEQLVLLPYVKGYQVFHPRYSEIFNSYYQTLGSPFVRGERGVLSRPSREEIATYRRYVDEHVRTLLESLRNDLPRELEESLVLGLNHEQQHQELILTDILHAFSRNPLKPAYSSKTALPLSTQGSPLGWKCFPGEQMLQGYRGSGFCYDNERPAHECLVAPFSIGCRLVTSDEYRVFVEDEGYKRPEFWYSDGWDIVQREKWNAPFYWEKKDSGWQEMTLFGPQPINPLAPISHISFYEASAYAAWAGARLPSETEWETVFSPAEIKGTLLESGHLRPQPSASSSEGLEQGFGDVWEWTSSTYSAYPGYQKPKGPLSEYNGKFMCNQYVLKGGSCFTPTSHIRASYRNFFPPHARWQCAGVRLARDL